MLGVSAATALTAPQRKPRHQSARSDRHAPPNTLFSMQDVVEAVAYHLHHCCCVAGRVRDVAIVFQSLMGEAVYSTKHIQRTPRPAADMRTTIQAATKVRQR